MKIRNPAPLRPERQIRGISSGLRAGVRGITVRDSLTDVHPTLDIKFVGATVTELDDDTAVVTIGGAGSGTPGSGGDPTEPSGVLFSMLNNSGQDLSPGDVVVVDETADRAVTVTTTEGDTRIAGVVQEPIADGASGLVLFNGYTPIINASGVTRGEYAQTATSAAQAISTADREAGSFAVYLTGDDIATDFAVAQATTTSEVPVTALTITMPSLLPVDRELFLALWLEDGVSSVAMAGGWTLIGSTADFYYYRRVSTGDDTAVATWVTSSTVVATVLLLHESVSLADPIEDFDYDATSSAASVAGLSDVPRYAIAAVRSDVASPGSGFGRLAGGTAGFASSGSPSLVQWTHGHKPTGATFAADPTVGHMLVAVPWQRNDSPVTLYDPRDPGSCPEVTDWDPQLSTFAATTGTNSMSVYSKIANETYAGPWKTSAECNSNASDLTLLEFTGLGSVAATASLDDQIGSDIDLGTFSGYGATDAIVMAVVFKKDGGGDPGVSFAADGFTELLDSGLFGFSDPHMWLGYKIGGTGVAKVTHSGGTDFNWGAAAIHLSAADQGVAGTLAGKYIGHDSSVTSPFTGGTDAMDAIFAVNLLADAKPSALLYGPDLGGAEGTTVDAVDVTLADADGLFTAADVEAALAELAKKDIGYQAHGTMGSTETFSALIGWHSGTFDDDCTFTFSGATSGIVASMVLELTEDGTGGWQPTWPGSVVWPGGTPPTHDDTMGTTTIYLFQSRDGGTTWFGFQAGAGGSSVGALDDLSDVTITTPAEDDQLQYISGEWVNNSRRWEPVTTNPGTGPEIVFTGDDIVMTWRTY